MVSNTVELHSYLTIFYVFCTVQPNTQSILTLNSYTPPSENGQMGIKMNVKLHSETYCTVVTSFWTMKGVHATIINIRRMTVWYATTHHKAHTTIFFIWDATTQCKSHTAVDLIYLLPLNVKVIPLMILFATTQCKSHTAVDFICYHSPQKARRRGTCSVTQKGSNRP